MIRWQGPLGLPPGSPAEVLQQLQWRYAVKRFDPARRIDAATRAALEPSLHPAPSSFHLQPWQFLGVETPALRQPLRAAAWDQPQVEDASHCVVFAGRRTVEVGDVDQRIEAPARSCGLEPAALAQYRQILVDFVQSRWAAADDRGATAPKVRRPCDRIVERR